MRKSTGEILTLWCAAVPVQQAQGKILAFYEAQGLLYDERAELERAYEAYCRWEGPEPFSAHTLSQEIGPTASGDRVIYFMTSVRSSASGFSCC